MGEGMAIGLDGMRRASIVGTRMAGLNGAVFTHHLQHANFNYTVPGEALAHLNGTPREQFTPTILVELNGVAASQDAILDAGIKALRSLPVN